MAAGDNQTILLVEDDPSLALGLCDALEFEGFRVVHTKSGKEGIDSATNEHPDCIILDLMLPDVNGYQVCEEVRKSDPRVPIIMLTARSEEADKIRGLDVGADDYVTKPFSVGELIARIRAIFRRATRISGATGARPVQGRRVHRRPGGADADARAQDRTALVLRDGAPQDALGARGATRDAGRDPRQDLGHRGHAPPTARSTTSS